jgi:acyl dehydratase
MSTPATVDGIAGVQELIGQPLGPTDWYTVSQEQVNLFADATDDHQWIHVDVERAKAGPFGGPIAHGFLTLSLIVHFIPEFLQVSGISMAVNYGLDRVRFPAPVPVGSRIRATAVIDKADEIAGGVQTTTTITIEIEGGTKPACVASSVTRYYA